MLFIFLVYFRILLISAHYPPDPLPIEEDTIIYMPGGPLNNASLLSGLLKKTELISPSHIKRLNRFYMEHTL